MAIYSTKNAKKEVPPRIFAAEVLEGRLKTLLDPERFKDIEASFAEQLGELTPGEVKKVEAQMEKFRERWQKTLDKFL